MIFDWDENKEKLNIKNHDGIDFDEASEAFYDENAFEVFDKEHSTAEENDYSLHRKFEQKIITRFIYHLL